MNKKGFTLIELLAVIVILAVVMLVGATVVLPMMQKSQKNSLATEGLGLIKASEQAYQSEDLKGLNSRFKQNDIVCFTMEFLCNSGYIEKGCKGADTNGKPNAGGDGYTGSVLVTSTNNKGYTYQFWISDGDFVFGSPAGIAGNGTAKDIGNVDDPKVVAAGDHASLTCGLKNKQALKDAGYVYCSKDKKCE